VPNLQLDGTSLNHRRDPTCDNGRVDARRLHALDAHAIFYIEGLELMTLAAVRHLAISHHAIDIHDEELNVSVLHVSMLSHTTPALKSASS
jgi:hypothetical protein